MSGSGSRRSSRTKAGTPRACWCSTSSCSRSRAAELFWPAVLGAWGWQHHKVEPVAGGLINQTFIVRAHHGAPLGVLQRLHPIFAPEVNLDIESVTAHLAAHRVPAPRLIRTQAGDAWLAHDGHT